jgi:hypothetical protein
MSWMGDNSKGERNWELSYVGVLEMRNCSDSVMRNGYL